MKWKCPWLMISLSVIFAFVISGEVSAQTTERVSVDSTGVEGDGVSYFPSVSSDGHYVTFDSLATNLVAGDTNGSRDVFVHDRQTGQTTRVSVDSTGVEGDGNSAEPSISSDGRYVTFDSSATNLVAGDTNGSRDVFVHDRQTGQTTRVSVDSTGVEGDDESRWPSISSDGRYVAFNSSATNLVAGDTNGSRDVFVHDRQTGQTTRVSVDSTGVEGDGVSGDASISSDGRYVTFDSSATNLVAGDTNGSRDVFVHDRQTGQTTRVSVDSTGVEGDGDSGWPSVSSDGHYVTFDSLATNLVAGDTNGSRDVFVHDRQTGQTTRVSVDSTGVEGDGNSAEPSISSDGRYVTFDSLATNLVAGDTNGSWDVFVHDRQTGQTTRVSVDSTGVEGDGVSRWPSISPDGRYVAFQSSATNLVTGDTNGFRDVFVHDTADSDIEGNYPVFSETKFKAKGLGKIVDTDDSDELTLNGNGTFSLGPVTGLFSLVKKGKKILLEIDAPGLTVLENNFAQEISNLILDKEGVSIDPNDITVDIQDVKISKIKIDKKTGKPTGKFKVKIKGNASADVPGEGVQQGKFSFKGKFTIQ